MRQLMTEDVDNDWSRQTEERNQPKHCAEGKKPKFRARPKLLVNCRAGDSSTSSRTGVVARNDKKELRAAHVGAGAGIDLDGFAFFDEERDVNGFTGFEFCRLGHVAGGIAAHALG